MRVIWQSQSRRAKYLWHTVFLMLSGVVSGCDKKHHGSQLDVAVRNFKQQPMCICTLPRCYNSAKVCCTSAQQRQLPLERHRGQVITHPLALIKSLGACSNRSVLAQTPRCLQKHLLQHMSISALYCSDSCVEFKAVMQHLTITTFLVTCSRLSAETQVITQPLTVTNTSAAPAHVAWTSSQTAMAVVPMTAVVPPGSQTTFEAHITGQAVGHLQAQATCSVLHGSSFTVEVSARVQGGSVTVCC